MPLAGFVLSLSLPVNQDFATGCKIKGGFGPKTPEQS
jgi:hypothetical protein